MDTLTKSEVNFNEKKNKNQLTCKNDFCLVFGNPLYIVGPLACELAGSLTTLNTCCITKY